MEAQRYLPRCCDKLLYLFSCLLMKPILLPIMMTGNYFFKSDKHPVLQQRVDEDTLSDLSSSWNRGKDSKTTKFVLAVQEANFIFSFTLNGFIGAITVCNILSDDHFSVFTLNLFILSCVAILYGLFVAIYLYGRKVEH